jgi:hypothetical protein
MHPERVVVARVSAVFTAVVTIIVVITAIVVSTAVGAFESLLLGHLFSIVQIIVVPTGGRPRAWATIVEIVATPIVFGLGRHLLVILPLHASDARRPSNGSRDLLLFDGVARCDCSGQDMPSATDVSVLLDLDG